MKGAQGWRFDAIKYNLDAKLIFGHGSSATGKSFLLATDYDGENTKVKTYNSIGNFKILQGSILFGTFDKTYNISHGYMIA